MTTILNASNSAGLVATADTSAILQLQTASTAALTITAAQNVGIGTTNASAGRVVVRTASTTGKAFAADNTSNTGFVVDFVPSLTSIGNDFNSPLAFLTNNTERMRIDSSGNVGIGTSSPRFKLSIGATTSSSTATPDTLDLGGTFSSSAGTNPKLRVWYNGTDSAGLGISSSQLDYITTSNFSHVWYSSSTERMRLDTSGNLLFNSGYGSVATAYGCRAWVNFNGTGTVAIRASGNVSSITDNGTGDYTVNITTAMPDANYAVSGTCVGSSTNAFSMICGAGGSTLATGSVRFGVIAASTGTSQDYSFISIQIFR